MQGGAVDDPVLSVYTIFGHFQNTRDRSHLKNRKMVQGQGPAKIEPNPPKK
jgi:hypothetical protein